jgi:hypothetical protein
MKSISSLLILSSLTLAACGSTSGTEGASGQSDDELRKTASHCTLDESNPRAGCPTGSFCSPEGKGTICRKLGRVGDWCDADKTCADGLSCARDLTGDPDSGVCQSGNSDCEQEEGGMCLKSADCRAAKGSVSGNFCDGAGTVCCHGP